MNTPQRITFVAPFGLGQKTTVWARTLPMARHLASQGHTVSIVIPPWDTPADAGKRWTDTGVEMIHVSLGGGTPLIVARMLRVIDATRPDIVHIVKPRAHAGLVQWWLWQRRRLEIGDWRFRAISNLQSPISTSPSNPTPKIILDVDDWEQAWAAINPYPRLTARFLAWQEEWGIRHADGITAASQWLVERVQQYTPTTPVLYLPNGVEQSSAERGAQRVPRNAELGLPQTPMQPLSPRILFFTRFVEIEPDWLAAFWGAVYDQCPAARLLMAGQALQPGREALYKQQIMDTQPTAAQQVEWLGYVDPAVVYVQADCAIFPSQNVPLLQAKCSVKLATTLLHGVPVIASAVGEQAAYGADGAAWLLPATATPAEFAQAVVTLLHDPARQKTMIAQARQHLAAHYPWTTLGQKLENFYYRFSN